jgi:hypothetical protein
MLSLGGLFSAAVTGFFLVAISWFFPALVIGFVVTVALVYLLCFIWIVLVVLFLGCVRFCYLLSDLCFVPGLFCFI